MIQLKSGILLIADPFLNDSHFKRSVILLCDHIEEGSVGFIINKKTKNTLNQLLPERTNLAVPVYYGGPVETSALQFIHFNQQEIEGSIPVTKTISWGGDFDKAIALIEKDNRLAPHFKFFVGYSGWSHLQLDEELKEKSWITSPASTDLVFGKLANNAWAESLSRMDGEYQYMRHYPSDPSLN